MRQPRRSTVARYHAITSRIRTALWRFCGFLPKRDYAKLVAEYPERVGALPGPTATVEFVAGTPKRKRRKRDKRKLQVKVLRGWIARAIARHMKERETVPMFRTRCTDGSDMTGRS